MDGVPPPRCRHLLSIAMFCQTSGQHLWIRDRASSAPGSCRGHRLERISITDHIVHCMHHSTAESRTSLDAARTGWRWVSSRWVSFCAPWSAFPTRHPLCSPSCPSTVATRDSRSHFHQGAKMGYSCGSWRSYSCGVILLLGAAPAAFAQTQSQPRPCFRWSGQVAQTQNQGGGVTLWYYGGEAMLSSSQTSNLWTNALVSLDLSAKWPTGTPPITLVQVSVPLPLR